MLFMNEFVEREGKSMKEFINRISVSFPPNNDTCQEAKKPVVSFCSSTSNWVV